MGYPHGYGNPHIGEIFSYNLIHIPYIPRKYPHSILTMLGEDRHPTTGSQAPVSASSKWVITYDNVIIPVITGRSRVNPPITTCFRRMKDTSCGSWWTPSRVPWSWRCTWPRATRPAKSWSPPLRWRASRCGRWSWCWKGMMMSSLEDPRRSWKMEDLDVLRLKSFTVFFVTRSMMVYGCGDVWWWQTYGVQLYEQHDLPRRSVEFIRQDNINDKL